MYLTDLAALTVSLSSLLPLSLSLLHYLTDDKGCRKLGEGRCHDLGWTAMMWATATIDGDSDNSWRQRQCDSDDGKGPGKSFTPSL